MKRFVKYEKIVSTQQELDAVPSDYRGEIAIKGGSRKKPIILKREFKKSMVKAIGKSNVIILCGRMIGKDKARIVAFGGSHVTLYGEAKCKSRGGAVVTGTECSKTYAGQDSRVILLDRSATAYYKDHAREIK